MHTNIWRFLLTLDTLKSVPFSCQCFHLVKVSCQDFEASKREMSWKTQHMWVGGGNNGGFYRSVCWRLHTTITQSSAYALSAIDQLVI